MGERGRHGPQTARPRKGRSSSFRNSPCTVLEDTNVLSTEDSPTRASSLPMRRRGLPEFVDSSATDAPPLKNPRRSFSWEIDCRKAKRKDDEHFCYGAWNIRAEAETRTFQRPLTMKRCLLRPGAGNMNFTVKSGARRTLSPKDSLKLSKSTASRRRHVFPQRCTRHLS